MTAYTNQKLSTADNPVNFMGSAPGLWSVEVEIDVGGTTATDTIDIVTLPAGSTVLAANARVTETAGETCTIDVGVTGGDVDGILDGLDLNQAVGTFTGTPGAQLAVSFAAETTLSALGVTGTTYAAGKFKFYALVAISSRPS